MGLKRRVTVLYEYLNPQDEFFFPNETNDRLVITGDVNTMVQERLVYDDLPSVPFQGRITWRNKNDMSSSIIKPDLLYGFNAYSEQNDTSVHAKLPFITTLKYSSYYTDDISKLEIKDFLPEGFDTTQFDWDHAQYDIILKPNSVEINKYSILDQGKTYVVQKKTADEQLESGIFYIDSQDDLDVNLSGLSFPWKERSNEIQKYTKISLFFKRAYVHSTSSNTTIPKNPISLESPLGLHPKVLIDLKNETLSQDCGYYLYSKLPLELFVDKFQSDPIFVYGEDDLELPEYKLTDIAWGSEALFELKPAQVNEIILHSRYIKPELEANYKYITFSPFVFKACDSKDDQVRENPFYSKDLGYESFFTEDTIFYPLNSTVLTVPIPRPGIEDYLKVKYTTGAVILFSILYLIFKIFSPYKKLTRSKK